MGKPKFKEIKGKSGGKLGWFSNFNLVIKN